MPCQHTYDVSQPLLTGVEPEALFWSPWALHINAGKTVMHVNIKYLGHLMAGLSDLSDELLLSSLGRGRRRKRMLCPNWTDWSWLSQASIFTKAESSLREIKCRVSVTPSSLKFCE